MAADGKQLKMHFYQMWHTAEPASGCVARWQACVDDKSVLAWLSAVSAVVCSWSWRPFPGGILYSDDSDTVLQPVVKNIIENKHLYSSGTGPTYKALVQPIHYCLTLSRILQSNLGSTAWIGIINKDRERNAYSILFGSITSITTN